METIEKKEYAHHHHHCHEHYDCHDRKKKCRDDDKDDRDDDDKDDKDDKDCKERKKHCCYRKKHCHKHCHDDYDHKCKDRRKHCRDDDDDRKHKDDHDDYSSHHIHELEKTIKAVADALASLGRGAHLQELLRVIHRPGWTSAAEFAFVNAILDNISVEVRTLDRLQADLVEASRKVTHKYK